MFQRKVPVIGFLVFVGIVLTIVSVFTKAWFIETISYGYTSTSYGLGIVPYYSDEYVWAAAASWMMFISLALYFVLALVYIHAAWKVHHHGCCHSIHHSFHAVAVLSVIIAVLEITAFVLMAINVPKAATINGVHANQAMGYSEYLALTSAILLIIAAGLSGYVSHHDCH